MRLPCVNENDMGGQYSYLHLYTYLHWSVDNHFFPFASIIDMYCIPCRLDYTRILDGLKLWCLKAPQMLDECPQRSKGTTLGEMHQGSNPRNGERLFHIVQ